MKISYNWLNNYIDGLQNITIDDISALLTDCGLEIDGIEKKESIKGGLHGLVTGEVLTCTDHPDSDHLHLTTVNIGQGEPLNIVCGASNVAAGQKVVVATIGTILYNGDESFTIKKSKIRGQESYGMICAEDEIGLGASHDGIMVLPQNTVVGMPAADYFGVTSDYIIEIGLTPNRSDATSHTGVARDLAALLRVRRGIQATLKMPDVSTFKAAVENPIRIEVQNASLCPRYTGLVIRGVKVAPSPQWLQDALLSIDLKPINNIVDITNYVLMETGQPLHAFDLVEIKGNKVVVRTAAEDEKFVTLDGVERVLSASDLMICNASEPMCIAGVFGGLNSGIKDTTTDVFLESAYFNSSSIRKTARAHSLNTDASFRYERGANPNITEYAIKRAALLIQEIAGSTAVSEITDVYPAPVKPARVELSLEYLNSLVGEKFTPSQVAVVLEAIEMKVSMQSAVDTLVIEIPTNKVDVTRPADVAEEFLRIYGYNNIAPKDTLQFAFQHSSTVKPEAVQRSTANYLAANGFYEILNNSLTREDISRKFYTPENIVAVANPLSSELGVMRPSLLIGGLQSIAYNINRKQNDLKMFEFGRTYSRNNAVKADAPVTARYKEEEHLSLLITGPFAVENWNSNGSGNSGSGGGGGNGGGSGGFYNIKKYADALWAMLRLNETAFDISEIENDDELAYGLQWIINKKQVLKIGKVRSEICKALDVKQDVFYADFNWSNILKLLPQKLVQYKEISKFPAVRRDLALLLDKQITFAKVAASVKRNAGSLLYGNVLLFDVYEGEHLPENKKSYAIGFMLQDAEKTLTDAQVEKTVQRVVEGLARDCGATLR
ncbi:MAG: phenylalanine--tRNA ligase subunit beta [Bacteroidales bacterium]|jgi:phenylalanyl-tRNA synthetase beta chain|nr:phenylalanine--tRNA ligase subunit beta [Bacteroidales bacterium]